MPGSPSNREAAIPGVGGAQISRPGPGLPWGSGEPPLHRAALIPEEECLVGDWLEDDSPLTHSRQDGYLPHPQGSGDSTGHSGPGSGSSRSPGRLRARTRQSRLPRLRSWNAPGRAGGDSSSAADPPRSPDISRASGPSGDSPAAGQPSVGAPLRWEQWGGEGRRLRFLTQPVAPLPSPTRVRLCPLPSGCECECRIVSSSFPSHTGKQHLPSKSPFPLCPWENPRVCVSIGMGNKDSLGLDVSPLLAGGGQRAG